MSVEQIAALCDIAPATWSTWERGTSPRHMAHIVGTIAARTGYSRDWLMWGGTLTTITSRYFSIDVSPGQQALALVA